VKLVLAKFPKPLELDVTLVQDAETRRVFLRVSDKYGASAKVLLALLHAEYTAKKVLP
jgi:hypothetical protein